MKQRKLESALLITHFAAYFAAEYLNMLVVSGLALKSKKEAAINIIIEIRGINQKANPQWEPGGGPTTRVDPGYEARTGIDAVNKANEVTYQLTNLLNARTTSGPGRGGSWSRSPSRSSSTRPAARWA